MAIIKPERLRRGNVYTYTRKSSWTGVRSSDSGVSTETIRVKLLEIKGTRVCVWLPPCDTYTNGHDTWINRDDLYEDITIEAPTNALVIQPIDKGRGKRERWHPRWAVVETLSGESLAVGRFVYKRTAQIAIDGARKSADRLVRAALANEDTPAKRRAMNTLRRYFRMHRKGEGFGT
jgi:hypothetical protein